MRTVPVKYSAGPLPEGCEPDLFISITLSSGFSASAFSFPRFSFPSTSQLRKGAWLPRSCYALNHQLPQSPSFPFPPNPLTPVKGLDPPELLRPQPFTFADLHLLNVAPSVSTANATFAL